MISARPCIAVATRRRPPGPSSIWVCRCCSALGFEYIDPMAYDDPVTGKHLLYWGSGFQPIKVQELGEDRLSFAADSNPIDLIWPNGENGSFPRLVEAAWVIRHDDFYYMFYSGDNCCGPDAEYGVMVARSESATGPFETLEEARGVPHSLMLFKSERWLAPGHNSIVTDKAGRGVDRLSRDRREQAAAAPGRRDQQPPDPADRPHRMAGWLAACRDSVGRAPGGANRLAARGPADLFVRQSREQRTLDLELLEQALVDVPASVREHRGQEPGFSVT